MHEGGRTTTKKPETIFLDAATRRQRCRPTKMCLCGRGCHDHTADICFYVPFCIVFVVLGIVQIISGIFYFITIPVIKLILNVAIGCWVSSFCLATLLILNCLLEFEKDAFY